MPTTPDSHHALHRLGCSSLYLCSCCFLCPGCSSPLVLLQRAPTYAEDSARTHLSIIFWALSYTVPPWSPVLPSASISIALCWKHLLSCLLPMVDSEFWEDHVWLFFASQSPAQGLIFNGCSEEHFLGSGSIPSICSHPLNGHVNWLIPYPEK